MVDIKNIKSYDEFNSFKNDNDGNLKVVKVGAEWCGPCRIMEDVIHNLEDEKINGVLFASVDIEEDGVDQVAVDFSIRNIPVLLFFKDGELVKKSVGSLNNEGIYNLINEFK